MINGIIIGQYFPSDSIIHRLDARIKVVITIINIVLIFFTWNYFSLLLITLTSLVLMFISKIPLRQYLKSMKAILIVIVFTAFLNLFYGQGREILHFGFIRITDDGINNSIFMSVRLVNLVIMSSVLLFTTSPTDMTDALERLMKPLGYFKIKVSEVAMMMTISLRFIPILLEETDKIMNAQKARGADFETGGIIKRMKSLIPVLIPLFVSAFRRAYDLAVAMECRCYNGSARRTKMKVLKMGVIDIISVILTVLLSLGVFSCNLLLQRVVS